MSLESWLQIQFELNFVNNIAGWRRGREGGNSNSDAFNYSEFTLVNPWEIRILVKEQIRDRLFWRKSILCQGWQTCVVTAALHDIS